MVPSRDAEFDLHANEKRGKKITRRVFRPAERRFTEMFEQPSTFNPPRLAEVVFDGKERFVIGPDPSLATGSGDKLEWILRCGDPVKRRLEEFLSNGAVDLHRCF